MAIINVASSTQFDELTNSSTLSVVHFWAPWATQCEPMDEAMKILAQEEPDLKAVNFLRVEAEEQAEISMKLEVSLLCYDTTFCSKIKKYVFSGCCCTNFYIL